MAAKQSLGEYCDRLGLSSHNLIDKLPAIKDNDLTNGVILEILTHFNNGAVDWCALKDSVYSIFGLRSESMPQTQLRTLFNNVLTRKRKLVRKKRLNDIHAFLDEPFKRQNDAAPTKRKCTESVNGCHSNQETDTAKITRLTAENHELKNQNRNLQHTLVGKTDQRRTMFQQIRRNQASCASWKKKFRSLRVLHNAAHKKIDLLQQQLAQSKDECERWSSRNRKARQRKQSTKVTRDDIPVVAPVKCQQVNRDVAALEDELEVLKESLEDRPVPEGQAGPWRTGRSLLSGPTAMVRATVHGCAKPVISYKILVCLSSFACCAHRLYCLGGIFLSQALFRAQLLKIPSPKK